MRYIEIPPLQAKELPGTQAIEWSPDQSVFTTSLSHQPHHVLPKRTSQNAIGSPWVQVGPGSTMTWFRSRLCPRSPPHRPVLTGRHHHSNTHIDEHDASGVDLDQGEELQIPDLDVNISIPIVVLCVYIYIYINARSHTQLGRDGLESSLSQN